MKKYLSAIDLDLEVTAIVKYLEKTWEPLENLEALIQQIRKSAEYTCRALFDTYPVRDAVNLGKTARKELLHLAYGEEASIRLSYDAGYHLLTQMAIALDDTREAGLNLDGDWDYGLKTRQVLQAVQDVCPGFTAYRPLGWASLEAGYSDFDGQEEFQQGTALQLFEEHPQAGFGREFVTSTGLPYVMHDEKCRGRKAHYILVSAVFTHFCRIFEQLNSHALSQDIAAMVQELPKNQIFEVKVAPKAPLLATLVQQVPQFSYGASDLQAALDAHQAYKKLPEEEKAKRKEAAQAQLLAIFANGDNTAPESFDELQAKKALKLAPIQLSLRKALAEQ